MSTPYNIIICSADDGPFRELAAVYVADGDTPIVPSEYVKRAQHDARLDADNDFE